MSNFSLTEKAKDDLKKIARFTQNVGERSNEILI